MKIEFTKKEVEKILAKKLSELYPNMKITCIDNYSDFEFNIEESSNEQKGKNNE